MEMRPFVQEDFSIYEEWFSDPNLNRELGPMDQEWLDCVLNESPPREFSFSENGMLVAVIGTAPPKPGECTAYITNIAVDPERKRHGIGRRALEILIQHFSKQGQPPRKWIAWVDRPNLVAKHFFEELCWVERIQSETTEMFEFSLEMKS